MIIMLDTIEKKLDAYFDGLYTIPEMIEEVNHPSVSPEKRREILEEMLLDWETAPEDPSDEERKQKWMGVIRAELSK